MAGIFLLASPSSEPEYIGILLKGQSNAGAMMGTGGSPPAASANTFWFDPDLNEWGPVPAWEGVRNLLNDVAALTGKTVRLVGHSQPATGILGLMEGSAFYTEFARRVTVSGIVAQYDLWVQGENDCVVSSGMSRALYMGYMDEAHGQDVALMGLTKSQCKFITASLAPSGIVQPPDGSTDLSYAEINAAHKMAHDTYPNIYFSHSGLDLATTDGTHMTMASCGKRGRRFAQSIAVLEGDETNHPTWYVTAAAIVDATHTDVTVVHSMGTDFTPTTGIEGFDISAGGAFETPSAAVRQNATTIRLTHSSMVTTDSRVVRYQYGLNPPHANPVLDNGALNAPLVYTHGTNIVAPGSAAGTSFRYWYLFFDGEVDNNGETAMHFKEVELLMNGTDQTGSGTALASSELNGSYIVANAFDNNAVTQWASDFSNTWPQWIGYDFGTPVELNGFSLTPQEANRTPENVSVRGGSDGVAANAVQQWTNNTGALADWSSGVKRTFDKP